MSPPTAAAAICGFLTPREQPVNRWLNEPVAIIGGETLELETGGERINLFASGAGESSLCALASAGLSGSRSLTAVAYPSRPVCRAGRPIRLLFIEPTGGASRENFCGNRSP